MIFGIVCAAIVGIIIIVFVILALVKPYGLDVTKLPGAVLNPQTESSYDHPLLTEDQEIMLESVGINPADVPTEITPDQEACSVEALGQERVDAIKAGSAPTMTDYLKSKHCYE